MPERNQYGIKTLTIDGKEVCAAEDQTILEVARENGIDIPTLCHFSGLKEIGACRLCVVEVKGSNKLLASCATQAQEGMEVTANSSQLKEYRKLVVELLLTERNHVCAVCVSAGHCELQTLAQKLGVDHVTLPYLHVKCATDGSHPRFVADHNRCILCTRCLRVCAEIEGAHTWDLTGRGIGARMISDMGEPWGNSASCTQCGKCVMVCPVGALVDKGKSVAEMTKPEFLPYLLQMRAEENQ
jgi:bidirectional [NiFe] hydrogenase diaphorase subunit